MEPKEVNIGDILLQQPPFRFVDSLESYDETGVTTLYEVPQTGVFVHDYRFEEGGIVENIAQASAARIGYISKYILHIPVQIGFIGQVRNLEISRFPKSGEVLRTRITVLQEVFGITSVSAETFIDDELIAKAMIKSALKDE